MTGTAGRRPTARPSATPAPTPAVAPTHVEPTRSRTVAASRAWLGTRTWPTYCAAGITAAYGALKAYWVFGGTALWDIAPLSQDMIQKARSHTTPGWFVIADAATVVLAAAGVFFALATVRPRRWLPVWLLRCSLWPLATLMALRAVSAIPDDVHQLATGTSTRTTLWDLVLWSPLFLIWGLLWAATALTYARRARRPGHKTDSGGCSWCNSGHGWDSLPGLIPVVAVTRAAGPPDVPSSRRARPVHALCPCDAPGRLTTARRDPADHPSAQGQPSFVRGPTLKHSHRARPAPVQPARHSRGRPDYPDLHAVVSPAEPQRPAP